MNDGGDAPRLNKHQLLTIEKSLFELARKQKSQAIPVDLPVPAFWSSVGQLLQHLEADLAETIRDRGMTAEAQLKSRRLGTIRTCVSDLTRLRLNAFTEHAVLSNLLKSPQGDTVSVSASFQSLDWVSQSTPEAPSEPPPSTWDDPEIDEEDRIRQIDAFPDRPPGAASPEPPPEPVSEDSGLRRILVLQDLDDPIITEDGSEITLTAGDVESCPAAIADNLIAAGMAEPAPL